MTGRPATPGPLRVAMDATPLLGTPTGVATFCAGALGGLAARNDVEMVAFAVSWRTRGQLAGRLPAGVTRLDRPLPARPLGWAWRVVDLPPIEWLAGSVDVVHGSNYVVPPARRAARVVTVHDLTAVRFPEMCEPVSRGFPVLVRRAAARGAWVHTHSEWVAHEVVELLGVNPDRVRVVPPGISHRDGSAGWVGRDEPVELGLPGQTKRYILALGTVEPRKDLPGLVRAFDRLATGHPDVALVLAGPDGWGAKALEEALDRSPNRARIVRRGWVSPAEREHLLDRAAVLAYPSLYEGFGFPPLEAMVTGVPVVATRAGSLPEVLGDGAALVEPGDADALAEALARLLDDDVAAAELASRGSERAGRYRWDRCAAGLAALYRDAADALMV